MGRREAAGSHRAQARPGQAEGARGEHEEGERQAQEQGGLLKGFRRKLKEDQTFRLVVGIGLAVVTVPPGVLMLIYPDALRNWLGVPYVGTFLVNFFAQFPIIPIPGLSSLGQALIARQGAHFATPWLVGLSGGLGMGLGEVPPYFTGMIGSSMVSEEKDEEKGKLRKLTEKVTGIIERFMKKWDIPTVFVLSAIPNPVLEIASISAGAARIPLKRYLPALVVGKIVRGLALAYIGQQLPFL